MEWKNKSSLHKMCRMRVRCPDRRRQDDVRCRDVRRGQTTNNVNIRTIQSPSAQVAELLN